MTNPKLLLLFAIQDELTCGRHAGTSERTPLLSQAVSLHEECLFLLEHVESANSSTALFLTYFSPHRLRVSFSPFRDQRQRRRGIWAMAAPSRGATPPSARLPSADRGARVLAAVGAPPPPLQSRGSRNPHVFRFAALHRLLSLVATQNRAGKHQRCVERT